jgi:ribonuclease D
MPDAIWIDRDAQLPAVAALLGGQRWIGLDTEFMRERTFFPKLCLLQLAAGGRIWCIDTLNLASLEPLVPALTAAASRKVIHSARQDLEAFYLTARRVISPVFDTQVAAACIGLKPQVGYAELVKLLLEVTLEKGQTRTDWSKRPLSRGQLDYAAEDVLHLEPLAESLSARLRDLGRESWAAEDCATLAEARLYEPDPQLAWMRLRGLAQLAPAPRLRAKAIAVWRERTARERDLPRSWIITDAAIFDAAHSNPASVAAVKSLREVPATFNEGFAREVLETLRAPPDAALVDESPTQDSRPTGEQKALIDRLIKSVDARAAELGVSAELLAPRGEIKALAMGKRGLPSLSGWRRGEIGERLLAMLD